MPEPGSLVNVMPGALTIPSTFLKGTSIPPRPLRSNELVISLAISSIVGLAQVLLITVEAATGLPAGREYSPAEFLLIRLNSYCANSAV